MTTGGERFLKIILIVFNAIFAIGGLVSLIAGGVALGEMRAGKSGLVIDENDHSLTGAAGLLIAIGVFVFITAVIGCIAALREHRGALLVYSIILIFILILQFAAAITAFVLKGKLQDFVHNTLMTMENSIKNDTTTSLDPVGQAFFVFQRDWKCCGVDGPSDWLDLPWFKTRYGTWAAKGGYNVTFPGCCFDANNCRPCSDSKNATTPDCVATKSKDALYTVGCTVGWTDYMKRNAGVVAGVAVSFGVIQIIGIILSCCLARSLNNQNGHERIG